MNYKSEGYFQKLKFRVEVMASDAVDAAIKNYVGADAWELMGAVLGRDRTPDDYHTTIARGILMGIIIARNKQAYEVLIRQRDYVADYFSMGLEGE